jgi:hypothetical protein
MLNDLKEALSKVHTSSDAIILKWDANNTATSKELSHLTSNLDLYELMPETQPPFSTSLRGSRAIDHIWGSIEILQGLKQHGYTALHDNAWFRDHRALYIDIDESMLFFKHIPSLHQPVPRALKATNRKDVITFLEHIEASQQLDQLLDNSNKLLQTTS